ncbi:MAG: glucokinase [Proteobacteria bacterium]|nr:glucokinase [Pseudomonadota bacterium]
MTDRADRPARVLGDVGGTNARFALQDGDGQPLHDIATLSTDDYPSLGAALADYLKRLGQPAPPWCAIGIANPITGDRVQMTNHHWSFSISELQKELGFQRLVVVNDFTALALALPELAPDEVRQFGGGAPASGTPIALLGPGTGLGVSGLVPVPHGGGWTPLQGEGGHVTLAADNDREAAVIAELRAAYGHASAERALSGPGLEALYAVLCKLDGVTAEKLTAAQISAAALGHDKPPTRAQCAEAVAMFCALLGSVAGNLALTLGARAGVYVGGGIVPRLGDLFTQSAFRERFEAKGRFRDYLTQIPVFVIHADVSPALLGASRAL